VTLEEIEHEIFLTQAQLEKQHQSRERIREHAKSTNDQLLAWSVVEECTRIIRSHSDCKAYQMF